MKIIYNRKKYKKLFDFNIKFINKEKDNVSGQGLFI